MAQSPVRALPLDFTLATERLILRLPNESDLPHVWSASRVPGFNDGMLWNPPEHPDELRGPLERAVKAWREGQGYQFSIDMGRVFAGRISLRPTEERTLDVGFWTHPDHQGRGLMTEALVAVADLAFGTLDAETLIAYHADWNLASRRVLEKAGFRPVRAIPGGFVKNGVAADETLVRRDRDADPRRAVEPGA